MPHPSADRNMLFGVLALQLNFVSRDGLIDGMNAWIVAKDKPLGLILCERNALTAKARELLDALVAQHLDLHDGSAGRSLAALHPLGDTARQLSAAFADPDIEASLAAVGQATLGSGASWLPSPPPPEPGARFRILWPHARGGLGEVFVAEDVELRRQVALKELQPHVAADPASRHRFLAEAEITGNLEHPGIVPVYGLGSYADGRPFYAMRFIKGESLKDAVEQFHAAEPADFRSVAFRQLVRRVVDVCNVVAYAHSRGVLHRDLKPENVMLGKFGETIVVDWGLAKAVGRPADQPAVVGHAEATVRPEPGRAIRPPRPGP